MIRGAEAERPPDGEDPDRRARIEALERRLARGEPAAPDEGAGSEAEPAPGDDEPAPVDAEPRPGDGEPAPPRDQPPVAGHAPAQEDGARELDPAHATPAALAEELDAIERELAPGVGAAGALRERLERLVAALGQRDLRLRDEVLAVRQRERGELAAIDAELAAILRQEAEEDALAVERLVAGGLMRMEARARVANARAARPPPRLDAEQREVRARADAAERPLQEERRQVQRLRSRARRLARGG